MLRKGSIIVLSAPSGAGKSTIYKRLLKKVPNLVYSVSTTTRLPRKNEVDGRDYCFVSVTEFKDQIRKKKFVEWAEVHGNYYGTSKEFIDRSLFLGRDVILDIDVQGGRHLKKIYPDAVMIFIMAPSLAEISRRLKKRNKDDDKVIKLRLKNAKDEIKHIPEYDYLVINDELNTAVDDVKSIIRCNRLKVKNTKVPKY